MAERIESFRKRLIGREPLVGTFLKTPSSIVCEVLGLCSLDVVCIDLEHAPFGPLEMDSCIATLRAADQPSLVRVADHSSTSIRSALDCGATGILVPHVTTAEQAAAVVKAARFGDGGRGYAGSTRAAAFTRKAMADHLADSLAQTTIIVQIEDIAALANAREIAAVDGVDAVFVGRIDLAVAMGKAASDPEIIAAVEKICVDAGETCVGMFTPDMDEIPKWRQAGATLYLLGSDHTFVLSGAEALARTVRKGCGV